MPAAVVSFIGSNLVAIGSALGAGAASAGVAMAVGAAAVVAGAVAAQKLISELYSVPNIDSDRSRQATVRGTVEPQKLIYGEALVSGPINFVGVAGTDNRDLYHSIVLAGHPSDSISDIYFDDERIQSAHINASGNVTTGTFGPKDGTTICVIRKLTGSQTTADSVLDGAFSTINSSEHIGTNLTYIVTKFTLTDKSQETWDKFLPNDIKALVKGKKVYDPRQDSTSTYYDATVGVSTQRASDSTTWAWSENPVWCLVDYLTDDRFGMDIDLDRIDLSKAVDAADICDATVSVPGGSEKRYTCNGVVFGTSTHKTNINKLLSSMNGMLTYTNGKYVIRAGAFEAVGTGMTLTEDHMTGPVRLKTSFERNERFNTITGTFIDPTKNYKEIEFPKVQITSALTRDNSEELTRELKLSMTNSRFMAQRIAHKLIQLSDLQKVLTFPTNLAGVNISVGDRVNVTLSEFGYSNKTFVCLGWTLSESGTGGVNLTLREDDSSSYEDLAQSGYSTVTPAGGIQQGFFGVPDPSGLTATAHVESIELDWTNPANMTGIIAIEVFASPNSSWSSAVKIGETIGTQFIHDESNGVDSIVEGDQRYYWVRARRFPSGEGSDAVSDRNPDSDTSTVQATKGALGDLASQDTVGDGQIDDNAVGNDQIADDAVDTDQIADDAVTVDKIANTLESTNYSEGSAGWRLTVDGDFEAADGDFRGAVKATTLDVEDATIHGTLTATNINAGIVTAETLAADVFAEFDDRYGSSGGFYQEDNDEFFDGSATKYVTLPTVTHDNSKNIYFQCNLVHSWGGTTNYTGDQLKLRVTFEYSTDNSTWTTVPNSGENSQVYYERITSKVIYFVTSAYDLAVDIRYTMSGSSLSDNTAYYFRAKIEYVSSTNVFQLAAAGSANGVPIKFNVQQSAGVTASGGDADSVDGLQASQFLRSDVDDTFDGDLTITGDLKLGDTDEIRFGDDEDLKISHSGGGGDIENDTGNLTIKNRAVDGDIYFMSDDGTGYGTDTYMMLDGGEKKVKFLEEVVISDDLTVTGNLTITGNIDQYNVTDLDVTDKTITVNSGSTQALSDGAGLIVDRGTAADASITWDKTNDEFDLSHALNVTGSVTWTGGSSTNANTAYTYSQVGHLPLAGGSMSGSINMGANNISNLGAMDTDVAFPRDHVIKWQDGGSAYSNIIKAGLYPSQGYTGTNTFWIEYAAKGGHNFIVNTDGGSTAGENSYDHFTVWQGAVDGRKLFWVTNSNGDVNSRGSMKPGGSFVTPTASSSLGIYAGTTQIFEGSTRNLKNIGTISVGAITTSASGTATSPVLGITSSNAASFIHASNAFAANMTAGQFHGHFFGKAGSTKNAGAIGYYWAASGSDSNFVSIGHWGSDHLLRLYGNGDFNVNNGAVQVGGTEVIASTRRFYASNGTVAKAAFSFDGESNTGMYKYGTNQIGFTAGGSLMAYVQNVSGSAALVVQGQINASGGNSGLWNTAYGWGDHSTAGYISTSTANTYSAVQTFEGTADANWRLHLTNSNSNWDALTFQGTNEWGDGQNYGVLGGDSTEGLMMRRPHVVWNSSHASADIRLGRSSGSSSGDWVNMGMKASNVGFIGYNNNNVLTWGSTDVQITNRVGVGGVANSSYPLYVHGSIAQSSGSIFPFGDVIFSNNSAKGIRNAAGDAGYRPDDAYGNTYAYNTVSGAGYYSNFGAYYFRDQSSNILLQIVPTTGVSLNTSLSISHSNHNYLYMNSTNAYEQMVQFKNSLTNHWYAGIRTSAGIASTADFHIYSAALGDDAFALTTSGDLVAKRNLNTKTGSIQINGTSVVNASRNFVNVAGITTENSSSNFVDLTPTVNGQILHRLWNKSTGASASAAMRIANSGNTNQGTRLEFSDQAYYVGTVSADRTNGMQFYVGQMNSPTQALRMTINTGGGVGINTSDPKTLLHVSGGRIAIASTDSSYGQIRVANTSIAEASIGFLSGVTESTLNAATPTATYRWAAGLGAYTGNDNQFVIGNVTNAGVVQINADGKTTFGETSGVSTTVGRLRVGTDTSSGWGTTTKYPWIGSDGTGPSLVMLQNPHVPLRTDNARTGASSRAGLRMARNSTGDWWDMGLIGDEWEIYRSGTGQLLNMKNDAQLIMPQSSSELDIGRSSGRTRKIVLWDNSLGNDYQFYGLGVESSAFITSIYGTADTFYWYAGVNSTSRQLAMSLSGTGNVVASNNITANGSFVTATSSSAQGIYAGSTQIFEGSTRNLKNLGTISSGAITATNGNVTITTGYNLQWGSGYSGGHPSVSATSNAMFFYPTGNVSGANFRLYASMAEIRDGNALRFQRAGNSAYGELTYDTGENITLYSSWGGKYLRFTRDGDLQLSGTTVIDSDGNVLTNTVIKNPTDEDAQSGTWVEAASSTSWGSKYGAGFAYTDTVGGYKQYNIPSGMNTCYMSQLQWSTGGYVDIHGVQSDGDLVFLKRVATYQHVEHSNHGNSAEHDGNGFSLIGSNLGLFTAIRITNKEGRFHFTGVKFTKESNPIGDLGVGTIHGNQIGMGVPRISGLSHGTTTIIDASRNLVNIGAISSGVITTEGTSGGKNLNYASNFAASGASIQLTLERTSNSTGWGGIGADASNCFSAWGGSGGVVRRFSIGQSGNADLLYGDYKINGTTVIDSSRDLFARQGTFTHTDHNYVKIEASINKEQMVRFKNSATNYWYAGIRVSNGIASTADFHIFSSALGDDAFALTTTGDLVAKRNLNTKTGSIQINGTTVIDTSRNVISANITNQGTMSSGSTTLTANYTGGSGDHTNVGNPPLKIVTSSSYPRVPVISANSTVSIVHNFETGKSVFWGESSDTGTYYFRGRDFYIQNGKTGIGVTPNSSYQLYVGGSIAQSSGSIYSFGDIVIGQGGLKKGSTTIIDSSRNLQNITSAQINGVGGDQAALLAITGSASNTFNWASKAIYANLTSGEACIHLIGQAQSTKNSGYIGYRHSSAGSNANALTFGHYSADHQMQLYASGQLAVNPNGTNAYGVNARFAVHQDANLPTAQFTHNSGNSTYGASVVIGNNAIDQTLIDGNKRPMLVVDGKYPVINLNHTSNTNDNHGPTIQFTFEGLTTGGTTGRQIVIGPDGAGNRLDFGFSGGGYGDNSNKNPHNGIAGYLGVTPMRLFHNGLAVGSLGTYPNELSSVGSALEVYGNQEVTGSFIKSTYNKPVLLYSSGTSSSGSAIGFQQVIAEGWTGIFVDYNPYEGWGLYHDNPSNYFYITAELSTGSLGTSFTVPNRDSGSSTAYAKIRFNQNNGDINAGGAITANGNVTAYASDRRLKTNFRPIESAVEKVNKLNGLIFDWNDLADANGFTPDRKHDDIGLIAQEVQEVVPQAVELAPFDTEVVSTPVVAGDKNSGVIEEKRSISGEDYLTVKYEKLVPLLVSAIKEQADEIAELKAMIKEIKDGNHQN